MDMPVVVTLDKTLYWDLSRLRILIVIIVNMQMSNGGQIQQRATISSFNFSPKHRLTLLEFPFIFMQFFQLT
jgi:hypothetical protein